jgi:hypothetical protein
MHFLFAEGLAFGVELGKGVDIEIYRNVGDVMQLVLKLEMISVMKSVKMLEIMLELMVVLLIFFVFFSLTIYKIIIIKINLTKPKIQSLRKLPRIVVSSTLCPVSLSNHVT